jgi:hypothetical protein
LLHISTIQRHIGQNVIYLPHEESKPYNRKITLTPNIAGLETIDLKPKSVARRLWLADSKLKLLAKEPETFFHLVAPNQAIGTTRQ